MRRQAGEKVTRIKNSSYNLQGRGWVRLPEQHYTPGSQNTNTKKVKFNRINFKLLHSKMHHNQNQKANKLTIWKKYLKYVTATKGEKKNS